MRVYTTRPSVQKDSGVSIVEDRQALFHLVQVQPLYTVSTQYDDNVNDVILLSPDLGYTYIFML